MKIKALIKPNSKSTPRIEVKSDGTLAIYVREPATESKANIAAIKLLAKHYEVKRSQIYISAGQKSKLKTFVIELEK